MTTESAVLRYLQDQNRPFSAINVADALNSQGIKKSQVQNALDSLSAASKVICQENGKQKVYLALQETVAQTPEELAAEEKSIRDLQAELESDQKRAAAAQQELKALANSLTLEECKAQLAKLKAENLEAEARLVGLRSGTALVTPEEREKAEAAVALVVNEWSRRRRIFNELFDTFADSSDKKPAALREEMGVEDDKAAGAAAAFDAARALVAEIGKRQMAAKRQRQG